MGRFLVLLVLALLTIAEVASVLALYDWVGLGGTAVILGLDMFFGVLIMRWAAASPPEKDRGWKVAGGAIVAFPGLVLDLFGLALLFPPTRKVLKRALARNVESAARRSGVSVITVTGADGMPQTTVVQGDVIAGEVVEPPTAGPTSPKPDAGGPPGVIRGEIVGRSDT
jgi:UPF0716 protein FxsA